MDARPGPVHDGLIAGERRFVAAVEAMAREAQRRGEIADDVDVEQVAFELQAALELANYHFVLFQDPQELERARRAIQGLLERVRISRRA